jgi:hypothetical protein
MACGDLIQSDQLDCLNILQGGVGDDSRLVLIQKTDIAGYTQNGIDTITAITLAANKSAYFIEGVKQSLKPKFEIVKNDFGLALYKHTAEFYYFKYDQVSKNNFQRMGNGRYVAIYANAKDDAFTYEILGIDVGLEMVEGMRAPQENGGAMHITLQSPDKEFESAPPNTFDGGTGLKATNKGLLDTMCFVPTVASLSIATYVAATPTAIVITGTNYFGAGTNTAVLKVELVNQGNGAIIPFAAALTVTSTTITTTTPVAVAGQLYQVRVTTKNGRGQSVTNLTTT